MGGCKCSNEISGRQEGKKPIERPARPNVTVLGCV